MGVTVVMAVPDTLVWFAGGTTERASMFQVNDPMDPMEPAVPLDPPAVPLE